MRFLISHNTNIVRQQVAHEWGADKVLTISELKDNLSCLPIPQDDDSIVFFVPTVFNYNNSLSYDGVKHALRILMYYLRNGKTGVNIVLMGNESELNFLLHYDYPNILKIPGVDYIRFNKKIVSLYEPSQNDRLLVSDYKPYLENLGLKMPSSFKSTHSLTNEWCLFKWNLFMGYEDNVPSDSPFYFDYLKTIEKIDRIKIKNLTESIENKIKNLPEARVLLIDDKIGWHKFFMNLFSNANNVKFCSIGENFNKLTYEGSGGIKELIINEIEKFDPHVILLDFRLMEDEDANQDNITEISGYKVLKDLKGTYDSPKDSYGRQVLIFTATSRIENISLLRKRYADDFILKEKPGNYNGKKITKDVISGMVKSLGKAVDRAKFLIPLNKMLCNLEKIVLDNKNKIGEELYKSIELSANTVRLVTQKNRLDYGIFKLTYLSLFSILENCKDTNGINNYINAQFTKLGLDTDIIRLWEKLNKIRIAIAHSDKYSTGKDKGERVTEEELKTEIPNLQRFIEEFMSKYIKAV